MYILRQHRPTAREKQQSREPLASVGKLLVVLAVLSILSTIVSPLRPAFVMPSRGSRATVPIQGYRSLDTVSPPEQRNRVAPFVLVRAQKDDDEEESDEEKADQDDSVTERLRKRDRIKDWISSASPDKPRIRAKFENLFAGMPSMSEILGADEAQDDDDDEVKSSSRKRKKREVDDSWFKEEKQEIMDEYEQILQQMMSQVEEQRKDDPESVPENAEAIIKSVLKQEMDLEIDTTREERARENLESYEKEKRSQMEAQDISGPPEESVQKLIDESEAEYAQQQASRAELEDFLRYEKEAFQRASSDSLETSSPKENEDLDQWALSRLEEMANEQQDVEGGEAILDILDENLEDLRVRMQKESARGSIRTDTMKEWQMYRSIATRLTAGDENIKESDVEGQILERLESWKDYVEKEEGIRKEAGLARRGPKLPFDWQESQLKTTEQDAASPTDGLNKVEARKQVNRMSIEALESLLETSDAKRRENLEKEIEYLKATLESNDYLDVDEATLAEDEELPSGPVDISDVFTSISDDEKTETTTQKEPVAQESDSSAQTPPVTPFFAGDEDSETPAPPPPPLPDTPFFSGQSEVTAEDKLSDSRLGSMEDQKLEAMLRRSKAKTPEERKRLKDQWKDYQKIEQQKRELLGLTGEDDTELVAQIEPKYNMSEVVKSDGDIDAEKILASIGPRPTKKKKQTSAGESVKTDTGDSAVPDDPRMKSDVDKEEVMGSLYRAVSAVGGGRFKDDAEGDKKQRALFEEYMEKENELRRSLDVSEEVSEEMAKEDFDDVEYAEEVLASLGPRPQPKRTRIIDAGDYSDKGGALASEDDEDEDISDDEDQTSAEFDAESDEVQPDMPEWLRREREEAKKGSSRRKTFLGSEIDEVFDDTDFDKNMRQLAEYERRRKGQTGKRQMGIDISDVLGRSAIESDDYADYKYDNDYLRGRQDNWGSVSFENRKSNLLDYTELDVAELNSLMDHKFSVHATGTSQYMPRINKPFKEFGAIFRLEGVLLDVNGLQLKAWEQTAEEYGYKRPSLDEVKRAAVCRPDIAVKEVFFWSDDFLQCRKVAQSHRNAFRGVFGDWMKERGIELPEEAVQPDKGSMAIGQEFVEDKPAPRIEKPKSEAEIIRSASDAWAKTATEYNKSAPTEEEVLKAVLLSPDVAVVAVFRWTKDAREADLIAQAYKEYIADPKLSAESRKPKVDSSSDGTSTSAEEGTKSATRPLTKNDMMELHFQAWQRVAETFGFDELDPEEAIAAFVINDPEIAIRDGFAWTQDTKTLAEAVDKFQSSLAELKGVKTQSASDQPDATSDITAPEEVQEKQPTADEIFQISLDAWSAVAQEAGLTPPDYEQVQFALTVGPEEAAYMWTDDDAEAQELVKSYQEELAGRWKWSSSEQATPVVLPTKQAPVSTTSGPTVDEIYQAALDSWNATAEKKGFAPPDAEQVQFALTVGPEAAITTGFQWTDNATEVSEILGLYKEELGKRRATWQSSSESDRGPSSLDSKKETVPPFAARPGASKWVKSLIDVEMQCGIISFLDSDQVNVLLEQSGLVDLFPPDKRVTASNGYNRESQQMLGAALRLERRPDHCVVFDTTPYASAAAHDVEMRSVDLIGPFPRYELLSADTTTSSFDDLTAMNIRRLFGERVYDQPMMDTQQAEPDKRQKTKTKYFWDDSD